MEYEREKMRGVCMVCGSNTMTTLILPQHSLTTTTTRISLHSCWGVAFSRTRRSRGRQSYTHRKHKKLVGLRVPSSLINLESSWDDDEEEEERGRDVRVSVWWDFENCQVPSSVGGYSVGPRIMKALRSNGVNGPLCIRAYGDISQLSRPTQQALTDTGISLSHIPGGNGGADRALLVDLVVWASQNPPPAYVFLISGDRDFSSVLHQLRMKNYNILLACRENSPSSLHSAASIIWDWNSLVKGEGFQGKQVNYPPDGSPNSWYQDAMEDSDFQEDNAGSLNTFKEPDREFTPKAKRQIPNHLKNGISDVLDLHPNGLSLVDLKMELDNKGIQLDTKYYGHRKLRTFLLAMQDIVKIKRLASNDGTKSWKYFAYPRRFSIQKFKPSHSSKKTDNVQNEPGQMHDSTSNGSLKAKFLSWIFGSSDNQLSK